MVKGIWEEDYELIDEALGIRGDKYSPDQYAPKNTNNDGVVPEWKQISSQKLNINDPVDLKRGINAYALAAELDKLEVLHYLELRGATSDCVSQPSSKYMLTPLMLAVNTWNVRVIEYLFKRVWNPNITDIYGMTAKDKAKIK